MRFSSRCVCWSHLRANRAAGHRDSARLGGGRLCGRLFLRACSFRSKLCACSGSVPAGRWCARPAARPTGHARRLSRAPRGTPHHGRRAARRGRSTSPTQAPCAGFGAPSPRGAWADGGVPRAAGVRRRACQARESGGPGSEWPEGTTPSSGCCQPESRRPARSTRSRMTPAATAAKSRYADGRSGAGEDAAARPQAGAPSRGSRTLDAVRRPRSLQWHARHLTAPSSSRPARCHS
jgi:hypothetical protein